MVRTEPTDLLSFEKKWIALQKRISETLPLIPVYSNAYFDFYSRELYGYQITEAVTWAEAITRAYISDAEELDDAEKRKVVQRVQENLK